MEHSFFTQSLVESRIADARRSVIAPDKRVVALERLSHVRLFSTLSQRELRQVLKHAKSVRAAAGCVIVSEGVGGDEFFVVVSGTARVLRRGRRVADLGPGSSFGELALLDRGPRNATILAQTDVELLVVHRRAFNRLLDDLPGFARKLLAAVATRLREADERSIQ
jgi:CRP-like cAMP-binding protein